MTYNDFIQNIISTRGQWNIKDTTYFEGHHIVPRCLGGMGDSKKKDSNIIWLLPEEHYEAHKLLALENPNNDSLVCAWHLMCFKRNAGRTYTISAEDYSIAKKLCNDLKSKPIICIETQEVFQSIQAAGRKYNDRGNISQAVLGKRTRAAGYHWAYLDDIETQEQYIQFVNKPQQLKKVKIICIETQEIFNSVTDAASKLNIQKSNISCCLTKATYTAGGYHWAYLTDTDKQRELTEFIGKEKSNPKAEQIKKYGHQVYCIELDKKFDSAKAAAKYINEQLQLKLSGSHIMSCCKGRRKTTGGYHWEFVDKEIY